MKAFVIAEAGSNHNGNFNQALKLIDAAVEAKCSAVKFQTFKAETLFSRYSPDYANYKNIVQIIRDNELPRDWQKDLKQYCDEKRIEFMSTPFDEEAVDQLVELGVKRLKIAGFESTDPRFVKYVARTGLPLIISLGIGSTYADLHMIYNWVLETGNQYAPVFLHCNNSYPTPYKDINLGTICALLRSTSCKIGLSDHTPGILTPPVAVSLGAECIEKHYTLSNLLPGPDHHFAIEPHELKDMVKNIEIVESMMGIKEENYTESEENFRIGTRAVIARHALKEGDILTEKNITTKRPCTQGAISAFHYYAILGATLVQDVREDEILTWEMVNVDK